MNSELEKGIINMFKNLSGLHEKMKDSQIWQREYAKFVNTNSNFVNGQRNRFKWQSTKYKQLTILVDNDQLSNLESQMRELCLNK